MYAKLVSALFSVVVAIFGRSDVCAARENGHYFSPRFKGVLRFSRERTKKEKTRLYTVRRRVPLAHRVTRRKRTIYVLQRRPSRCFIFNTVLFFCYFFKFFSVVTSWNVTTTSVRFCGSPPRDHRRKVFICVSTRRAVYSHSDSRVSSSINYSRKCKNNKHARRWPRRYGWYFVGRVFS